ncbi:hypothetical protein G5B35_10260 [Parapusillimonas sp. SGNA-6]|nr:hypothetical protein [Parapusillimonas sp. SGNA-6]
MYLRFRTLLAGIALIASAQALAADPADPWPVSPSVMQLATPYGNLHVATSEYIYESRLRLNDVNIEPAIQGILNITHAFSLPKAHVVLVSINSGNNVCPIRYRWVVLRADGYDVSPEFGSCSDKIKVSAKGQKLTLKTPSLQKPDKIDVYIYDGKTIRHRSARQP